MPRATQNASANETAPLVPSGHPEFTTALKEAGLRVTARLAVLSALHDEPHADTESVIGRARQRLGAVSPQAVYNVLAALAQAGLVRRIEPAHSPPLYELRVGDNHHHAVCRNCLAAVDVDCVVGRRPCLTPSEAHGFVLDEAEVTFWGICPACQPSLRSLEPPATTDGSSRKKKKGQET